MNSEAMNKPAGSLHVLERKTFLPTSLDRAWAFFSDPRNLAYITPEEMEFRIKTTLRPGEFYPGMLIEYVVRPFFRIPVRWVSEICEIRERKYFTDRQVSGPYAYWWHRHEFTEVDGGVEMRDIVEYRLPLGWLGRLVQRLVVRRKLEHIFDYREKKIRFLFHNREAGAPGQERLYDSISLTKL